ncbi:NADH:flavin oxidoreductase [Pseudonocardia sp. N23]|nr:NADH:flavin oxidoreductase [Pseudonocardia sp. N23]
MIGYLDLALWGSRQIVQDGTFRGRTMLSVFAELPRKGVRLGVGGKVHSAERCGELMDEGSDVVLIARAGILERDFPRLVAKNHRHESPRTPVPAQFLRPGGLSERMIDHMRGRRTSSSVAPRELFRGVPVGRRHEVSVGPLRGRAPRRGR